MTTTNSSGPGPRRLELKTTQNVQSEKKPKHSVANPYLKPPEDRKKIHDSSTIEVKNESSSASTKIPSHVTPETGIDKFFPKKRGDEAKPSAARKLVTPFSIKKSGDEESNLPKKEEHQRQRLLGLEERIANTERIYYSSADEENLQNEESEPCRPKGIHSSLNYYHRGELSLKESTLKAYNFVRKHFLIPIDIETDPKYGPHSGSCFEERVLRAYSLGKLEPKHNIGNKLGNGGKKGAKRKLDLDAKEQREGSRDMRVFLRVFTYCGEEGHVRDCCDQLL